MSLYDSSNTRLQLREYLGTKVYMASHPAMRPLVRGGRRPTEFGDRVWDMTLAMMSYLDGVQLGRVVDVGCGWGLLGVHLARRSTNIVTCADIDENLRPIVQLHAQLNQVPVDFVAASFSQLPFEALRPDVIVAAEICYNHEVCLELCEMMDYAAQGGVQQAIIADLGRPDFMDLVDYCSNRFHVQVSDLKLKTHSKPRPLMTVKFTDKSGA